MSFQQSLENLVATDLFLGFNDAQQDALETLYDEGFEDGLVSQEDDIGIAFDEGRDEGYECGYDDGYQAGLEEAESE